MEKQEFQTESKKILDMMINSVYTHKEIFLRELISNASDALDKLAYISLTDDRVGLSGDDFYIRITADREKRTLTVSDNGVGMSAAGLAQNLGTIAHSGSLEFKNSIGDENRGGSDIIGRFGVGFYSAFMVGRSVAVISREWGSEEAWRWESDGADGYTVSPASRDAAGTDVVITLKDDGGDDGENYSQFLDYHTIKGLVKKYSDYIRFRIIMDAPRTKTVETGETDEKGNKKKTYEEYFEEETLNSRIPIWKRSKDEVSDGECNQFYREKYFDREDPALCIRADVQGLVSYRALLFIPAAAPLGYYTRDFEKGLSLYSNGVMILEKCPDLLPEHFRFVKGVADSDDLSLNISRELLQHDRQLKVIATSLEKRIKKELKTLLEENREKYEAFFRAFGLQLKYGVVNEFGAHKDLLSDLLLFYSAKKDALVSLSEYVADMPEGQKHIYYACGENAALIKSLPQAERALDRGYDLLCLSDEIDEFVMGALDKFEDRELRSVNADDDELVSAEEKEKTAEKEKERKDLLSFAKDALGGAVESVRLSSKLKSHPVFLTSEGGVSIEMEKYFASLPGEEHPKAKRVLELNPEHPAFRALEAAHSADPERAADIAKLLYSQSLLIAGLPLENPTEYTELVCRLLV